MLADLLALHSADETRRVGLRAAITVETLISVAVGVFAAIVIRARTAPTA